MTDMPDTGAAPIDHAKRAAELERRLGEIEAVNRERLVRAELKAEAVRAGMVDLDGLKLVGSDAVRLDEHGEVANAEEVMRGLRLAKPWLFANASSSSTAAAPPAQPPRPRLATEMSFDEWQAARSDLLRRR